MGLEIPNSGEFGLILSTTLKTSTTSDLFETGTLSELSPYMIVSALLGVWGCVCAAWSYTRTNGLAAFIYRNSPTRWGAIYWVALSYTSLLAFWDHSPSILLCYSTYSLYSTSNWILPGYLKGFCLCEHSTGRCLLLQPPCSSLERILSVFFLVQSHLELLTTYDRVYQYQNIKVAKLMRIYLYYTFSRKTNYYYLQVYWFWVKICAFIKKTQGTKMF